VEVLTANVDWNNLQ